jgi:hypothetical protein
MADEDPQEQAVTQRLQRAVTGRLRRWDTAIARQDGALARGRTAVDRAHERGVGGGGGGAGAGGGGAHRQPMLARTQTRGRLRRFTTQHLPVGADQSENAPPVVIAQGDVSRERSSSLRGSWKQLLVAPISGMIAGAIEITVLWPTEWAKVQKQLPGRGKDFSVLREMRKQGFGIYRGLTPMLIGAPLQCAVRFSTLDSIKAALAGGEEQSKNAGRATALAAGMCAGVAEALLVVTPMETVKTRLVDADAGLLAGVRRFYAAEGLGGFYKVLVTSAFSFFYLLYARLTPYSFPFHFSTCCPRGWARRWRRAPPTRCCAFSSSTSTSPSWWATRTRWRSSRPSRRSSAG